jgi:hypothetical protein
VVTGDVLAGSGGCDRPRRRAHGLIEVQTGAYLGEDDNIRYKDIYARQ